MMEQLIPIVVVAPLLVFWMWMFWDMSNNDDLAREAKNYWTIAFVFFNIFTAAYYYINVYRYRR